MVYTPLHGVAGPLMLRAIERAGYPAPYVVPAQAEPDPDFPTVSFPNPEEPGALDLALADARRLDAGLVLASDPDGDRLAVAVPDPAPRAAGGSSPATRSARCSARSCWTPPRPTPTPRSGWSCPPSCPRRCCPGSPPRPASGTRRPLLVSSGSSGRRAPDGFRFPMGMKKRSGTRSAGWCGTRTESAPRSPCSAWPARRGRPASRCWTGGTRWRRRTGCTCARS